MFTNFPIIDLGSIKLREIQETDVNDFYKYITNPKVKKYLFDEDIPSDLERAKSELMYWASLYSMFKSIYWAIADTKNNKLIGTAGFNTWNVIHKRVEISYDLCPDYWGKGLMTQVVRAITNFAFDKMDVLRSQATVATDNISSIRVLEKCGYKNEGILKKFAVLHGESRDFYMYAISRI